MDWRYASKQDWNAIPQGFVPFAKGAEKFFDRFRDREKERTNPPGRIVTKSLRQTRLKRNNISV